MTQEVIFRLGVDTGDTDSELKKVNSELNDINESANKVGSNVASKFEALNEKVSKGGLSVREYSRAVKEYQSIALEAGRTSPIGQEALQRAGALSDELGDLRNEVAALGKDGANMQAALQLGSSITAGYGAVQGAMALTGMEGENLQKTMVKLQAATSVLNGLEQIRANLEKESQLMIKAKSAATAISTGVQYAYTVAVGTTTGAMKALRIAMLAVPIVALIAGIVALISWLSESSEAVETLEEANDKLTDSIERSRQALDRQGASFLRETENKIKLAKAYNKSADEIHGLEIERIQKEEVLRRENVKFSEKVIKEKQAIYKRALREGNKDEADSAVETIKTERDKLKNLKAMDGQFKVEIDVAEQEFRNEQKKNQEQEAKEQADRSKKAAEDRKRAEEEKRKEAEAAAQKQLELERTITDLSLANMKDGEEKKRLELKVQQDRERQDLIKKYGEDTKLIAELEAKQFTETQTLTDQLKKESEEKAAEEKKIADEKAAEDRRARLEGELIQMREDFEARMEIERELALFERDEKLKNTELTEGEKFKIEQEYQAKLSEIKQKEVDDEKATNEALIKSRQSLLSAVSNIFGQLSGLAKQGSTAQKALALTEIGINTAVGFINGLRMAQQAALATGPAAPFAFPIFFAQQIATVIGAANQARKILGDSSSVAPPQSPTSSAPSNTFNNQNQTNQQNQQTQGTLTAGLQGASKVYVTESDMTATQLKVKQDKTISTID